MGYADFGFLAAEATAFEMAKAYVLFMSLLFVSDRIIGALGVTSGRWFALHAVANFTIMVVTFSDLANTAMEPQWAVYRPTSAPPIDWTNAALLGCIHLYHMVFFKCNAADWFHHLVFVPFNQLAFFWPHLYWGTYGRWGSAINMQQFFVCGLPGGLDYLMLALVKEGKMDRFRHKLWQAKINVWMRAPGLIMSVTLVLFETLRVWETAPLSGKIIAISDFLLIGFNGLYYMEAVVESTGKNKALFKDKAGMPLIEREHLLAPLKVMGS
jgi:hypothetical protein